jgi:hypothetical protein
MCRQRTHCDEQDRVATERTYIQSNYACLSASFCGMAATPPLAYWFNVVLQAVTHAIGFLEFVRSETPERGCLIDKGGLHYWLIVDATLASKRSRIQ